MPTQSPASVSSRAEGSCHCGKIRFCVDSDKREILRCNCSMCTKTGHLHLIVEANEFTLQSGEEALGEYRFGTRVAKHYYCKHCGVTPFYVPRSHPHGFSINFRCLSDYHDRLSHYQLREFDGDQWEANIDSIR